MLAATVTEGAVVLDREGRILRLGSGMVERWPAAVQGRSAFDFVDEADRSTVSALLDAVGSQPGETVTHETEVIDVEGRRVWVEATFTNLFDDPAVGGILARYRDITERREAARDSALQARLLDAVGQAVIATDPEGVIIYWNRAAEDIYGWTADDAVGRRSHDLVGTPESETQGAAEAIRRGEGWSGELVVRRRGGQEFPVYLTLTPVTDPHRGLVGLIGVSADISERRSVEWQLRRLSDIVESSGDAVLSKTPEGVIITWNPAAERLYGYTAAEAVGRHVSMIVPDDRLDELEFVLAQVAVGSPVERLETVRRRADGTLVDVSVTISPVCDSQGVVVGASSVARDVGNRRRAEEAIERSRRQLAEAQRIAGMGSFEIDLHTGVEEWSEELHRMAGLAPDAPSPSLRDMVHPEEVDRVDALMTEVGWGGGAVDEVVRTVPVGGVERWARVRAERTVDVDSRPKLTGTVLDVTERIVANQERARAETRFAAGFERSSFGMALADLEGRPTMVNPALSALLGRSPEELVGRYWTEFQYPEEISLGVAVLRATSLGHDSYSDERRYVLPDGSIVWVQANVTLVRDEEECPAYYLVQIQDITARKEAERQLAHRALHDDLTGLPNRALLDDRLEHALSAAATRGTAVGVAFLDVDSFKDVNDALGHAAGDRVLVEVADRLRAWARPEDTIARFGGDEFVVVREDTTPAAFMAVADELRERISKPHEVEGSMVPIRVSLGVAIGDGSSASHSLLAQADAAMYRAKELGRHRVAVFDVTLREQATARLEGERWLAEALERDEVEPFYQPIMDMTCQRPVGIEALARWRQPDGRIVPPSDFIPAAERSGMIVPLGIRMLERATMQVAGWNRERLTRDPLWVSVNLSARQLAEPDLVETVARTLEASGLPPSLLHLEVTESLVMEDVQASIRILEALRQLGVCSSIDDFGTGFSSLSYLKLLPVDILKVDRSFVDGLGTDPHDTSIVGAILSLGRALDLDCLAEGVETEPQRDALLALGCKMGQGYLWSPPREASKASAWLRRAGGQGPGYRTGETDRTSAQSS